MQKVLKCQQIQKSLIYTHKKTFSNNKKYEKNLLILGIHDSTRALQSSPILRKNSEKIRFFYRFFSKKSEKF